MDAEVEVKIIISFLFKYSGKERLTLPELYLPLSMDLKWFSPKKSKDLINLALLQKLLIKKGDLIKANFDYKKILIPVGFHPSEQAFERILGKGEKLDVLEVIIGRIVEKTKRDRQDVFEEIKRTSRKKNIFLEVAALLISRGYNINIKDCFGQVERKIFRENAE